MAFNTNDFRQALRYGGARANQFEIMLNFPDLVGDIANQAGSTFRFLANSASIPDETVGEIQLPYFGRNVNFVGDRSFDEWTVTVYNDEDFLIRAAFERWQNQLASMDFTTFANRDENAINPMSYIADIAVRHLSKNGKITQQYQLRNAFPTTIANIELSWDPAEEVETFDVTLRYDYHVVLGPNAQIGENTLQEASQTP